LKALISRQPGGPDTLLLDDLPMPVPGSGEVRIAVRACAINYPDVLIIEDRYQFKPARPFAPGVEIAGVIESVAPDVTEFVPGQRVMGILQWGGLAEFAVARTAKCTLMPDAMSFEDGAAFQVTYGTTYHALVDRAALKSGETLLVLGASGGVGLAAIQLGVALGARVVAGTSSAEKGEIAKRHGAHELLIYPTGSFDPKSFAAQIKGHCPTGVDVIYDPIGGAYAEPALRSLAFGGRHLVIGFTAGIPSPPWNLALLKGCSIVGVFWGVWVERFPDQHKENSAKLLALYERGAILPLVSERLPLSQAATAIRRLADRTAVGKLVITL
jgi:NADPH2:quinone reductase